MNTSATYDKTKPGGIAVPLAAVHAYWADKGTSLDAKITAHITAWAASVPAGTLATVADMMNASGHDHGLPVEAVLAHLFPPGGSPCPVTGVAPLVVHGPLTEHAHGHPHMIKTTG